MKEGETEDSAWDAHRGQTTGNLEGEMVKHLDFILLELESH